MDRVMMNAMVVHISAVHDRIEDGMDGIEGDVSVRRESQGNLIVSEICVDNRVVRTIETWPHMLGWGVEYMTIERKA